MYYLKLRENTILINKNFHDKWWPRYLKLHVLKHFNNLLQNKYQEIREKCMNTLDTQK